MFAKVCRVSLPPLIVISALGLYRLVNGTSEPVSPRITALSNTPAVISPQFNEPRLCTDEQLAQVLDRVKPPAKPVNTNNLVHALRLWGPSADFGDSAVPSGREMRAYFLDDKVFRRLAGDKTPPLFYHTSDGIEVRSYDDGLQDRNTSSFHMDDLLATLAETGTPLDTPLHLRDGEATVADLLNTTMRRFYLDRLEYEWTAISYVRYLYPLHDWRNKYGEKITVEKLAQELLDHQPEAGPCDGLHRLEALVLLYRVDAQARAEAKPAILPERLRQRILSYMQESSRQLVAAQSSEGYWSRGWSRAQPPADDKKQPITLHDKLLVTGHHLEWLALAPEEVQPPRENIVRAGQWLTKSLLEMDAKNLVESYGPYSHAARALCLWRNVEPFAAWKQQQVTAKATGG